MINQTPVTDFKADPGQKKILIGVPAYEGIVYEAQQAFFTMMYWCGKNMPDYTFAVNITYKREQFRARNNITDAAIANEFDYILMLDDDMIVPPDLVQRLIDHDKDVIGALYFQRGGQYKPVLMNRPDPAPGMHTAHFVLPQDPRINENRGLHQFDVIGGGCMLFKTHVFNKILQPYFETERNLGTDISICGRLKDAGFEIWADTSIELGHVGEKKIITSRTVPMSERVLASINDELHADVKAYLSMHDEELSAAMDAATPRSVRQDVWGERDATDWEEVSEYYRDNPDWHVVNLCFWALYKNDPMKEWVVTHGSHTMNENSRVLDYGAGLGHISVPLARRHKATVYAADIEGSATQQFVEYRKKKHCLDTLITEPLQTEIPKWNYEKKLDGAAMISVIDHLMSPRGVITWIKNQLKPGAWFVCEWNLHSDEEEEPQHLNRHDPQTFKRFMESIGFEQSPEHTWLFFYKG